MLSTQSSLSLSTVLLEMALNLSFQNEVNRVTGSCTATLQTASQLNSLRNTKKLNETKTLL